MKYLIVIDDFYSNPAAVRNFALTKTEYLPSAALPGEFPGTESKKSFFTPAVVQRLQSAVGEKVSPQPARFSFGVFAKAYAQDHRKKVVHVDHTGWTGLVYLNPPEQCRGGTSFYRHKGTGLDRVPEENGLENLGYTSRSDFLDRFLRPISSREEEWEVSARVGMKFNRLVLFRAGDLFHAAEGYFGNTDEEARLIQLFFFETEKCQ